MRVRIHQARQERRVPEIDRPCSRRCRPARLDDPFAFDDDQTRLDDDASARIEHARRADGGGLRKQEDGEQDHENLRVRRSYHTAAPARSGNVTRTRRSGSRRGEELAHQWAQQRGGNGRPYAIGRRRVQAREAAPRVEKRTAPERGP